MPRKAKIKSRKEKKPPEQLIKQPYHGGRPGETKEEYRKRQKREQMARSRCP